MSTDIASTYQRTQVLTAGPEQLRLMLLEGAVRFARQGRDGILSKNYEQIYIGFCRSRDIVVELMTSIRPDTDPTLRSQVQGLYMFIFKQLADASLEKDVDKAEKAIGLLEYEVETWKLAMQKAAEERAAGGKPVATQRATVAAEPGSRPSLSLQG
jgi:flagellar secretion chaperone FliS